MKYAIISDIHGNAPALRLALADAQQRGADAFLFAGDYCISAPWAEECVSLIRRIPNARIIRGNDEAHLDVPDGDDGQFEASRWCARSLCAENKAWLDALPEELSFCEGSTMLHMAHASSAFVGQTLQTHFRTSIYPARFPLARAARQEALADFRTTLAADDDFMAAVRALDKGVYIFGHNHIQAHGCFDGRWLVNPGSCGMPLDAGDFAACYSLLTIGNGQISVEERRIAYDVEALIARAKATSQYTHARIWSEVIFSEWRTCREKVFYFLSFTEHYAQRIGDTRRPFAKDTWQAAYDLWLQTVQTDHPELFVR